MQHKYLDKYLENLKTWEFFKGKFVYKIDLQILITKKINK